MECGRFSVRASGRESQRHPRRLEMGDLLARCVLEAKVVCVFVSRSSSALGHAAKKASGVCAGGRSCSTSSIICSLLSSSSASFSKQMLAHCPAGKVMRWRAFGLACAIVAVHLEAQKLQPVDLAIRRGPVCCRSVLEDGWNRRAAPAHT